MSEANHWEDQFLSEIKQAKAARNVNNEGMARVCARRAVGIILGEYFLRQGMDHPGPSTIDRIRAFQSIPDLSPLLHDRAAHFLKHVSPERTLPAHIDLIIEAEQLRAILLD